PIDVSGIAGVQIDDSKNSFVGDLFFCSFNAPDKVHFVSVVIEGMPSELPPNRLIKTSECEVTSSNLEAFAKKWLDGRRTKVVGGVLTVSETGREVAIDLLPVKNEAVRIADLVLSDVKVTNEAVINPLLTINSAGLLVDLLAGVPGPPSRAEVNRPYELGELSEVVSSEDTINSAVWLTHRFFNTATRQYFKDGVVATLPPVPIYGALKLSDVILSNSTRLWSDGLSIHGIISTDKHGLFDIALNLDNEALDASYNNFSLVPRKFDCQEDCDYIEQQREMLAQAVDTYFDKEMKDERVSELISMRPIDSPAVLGGSVSWEADVVSIRNRNNVLMINLHLFLSKN
ncbi:hypothetical protein, partial [Vibrio diabolicus]|uniref:hypothetical protein n=1 Tax=Vibrio diabolicus TaxID=50719 RepID=UPI0029403442